MDPEALGESLTYNLLMNRNTIKAEISLIETDMASSDYFASGKEVAEISTLLLGPVPSEIVPVGEFYSNSIDFYMVNHILAGFIYGMTTENHLTEIMGCYKGGADMNYELT